MIIYFSPHCAREWKSSSSFMKDPQEWILFAWKHIFNWELYELWLSEKRKSLTHTINISYHVQVYFYHYNHLYIHFVRTRPMKPEECEGVSWVRFILCKHLIIKKVLKLINLLHFIKLRSLSLSALSDDSWTYYSPISSMIEIFMRNIISVLKIKISNYCYFRCFPFLSSLTYFYLTQSISIYISCLSWKCKQYRNGKFQFQI